METPRLSSDDLWLERDILTFWLWAVLRDGDAFLRQSTAAQRAQVAVFEPEISRWQELSMTARGLQRETQLASYHFVSTMGVLIRVLKRAKRIFPEIQPAYDDATHLLAEGKQLRDMVEHAYGTDGYLAGAGHHPERFVRQEAGIAADAISMHVDEHGHWLGNRLCVEQVMKEVSLITNKADKIELPEEEDD